MNTVLRCRNYIFLICILFAAVSVLPTSAHETLPYAPERERLVIATRDNGPVSIDRLLYLAFRNIMYSVDFICPIIRDGYTQADSGAADGVIAGYPGLEDIYTNLRRVPVPLERISVRVFARNGSEYNINSWDELAGMRVGILKNRTYILERLPEGAVITENETNRAALTGLVNGEYDVAVLAEREHETFGEGMSVDRVGIVDVLDDYLYLNAEHEALIPVIAAELEELYESGKADHILNDIPLPELNQKRTIVHIISTSIEINRQDRFTTELRSHFEDDMSVEWITVNLDARRFTRGQYNMAYLASLLRADIVSRNVYAVVVSGETALSFLNDYYYLYFRNTPVLFYGVSEHYQEIISESEAYYTGIVQNIEAAAVVGQGLKMFPDTAGLFIVNDFTDEGIQYRSDIEAELNDQAWQFPDLHIAYSENVELSVLMEHISRLPDHTIVLVGSYFVDAGHQYYTTGELKRLMERHSAAPVMSLFSLDPAYNAVGGKCLDFELLGAEIADMLIFILNGGSVSDIPVIRDSAHLNRWVFDQIQLDRFNISAGLLPDGALIVNRVPSIRESNPQFFSAMVILAVISVLLVVGAVVFFYVNSRYNKQKNKLRQELAIEKSMLEIIFNSVPEILWVKDLERVFIRINKQFEEFFAVKKEQLTGGGDEPLNLPEDVRRGIENTEKIVINENRLAKVDLVIAGASGAAPFFEIIATPLVSDGDTIGIVGVAYDITHRKQTEDAAQAASRAKSNFLANMSHEMRTPLTAVLGLTEFMIETTRFDDETLSNLIKVNRAGETILGLVNDVLDISKIEAERFELNEREYDLPSLINDTITQSMLYAGEKPVTLKLDISDSLPNYLYGDDLRIRQIANNLLSNAFKFTKEGTVTLSIETEYKNTDIKTGHKGDDIILIIEVRDTGIGIRAEDMDKLFTMYAKMEEEGGRGADRRTEGTGLGLSISKRVAEMMDGTVTAESEYGKGSIFTARLTQKYVNDSVIGKDVADNLKNFNYSIKKFENAKMTRLNMSYASVLVVDDNHTNLDVARGLMGLYGMRVDCVDSGYQAIELIKKGGVIYDAVFMDHMMPDMDGIEATRVIREEIGTDYAKNVPIIALTANAIVGNEEMFLQKGFQAFISKPIDLARLDAVIRQWVRNRDKEALLPERTIVIKGSRNAGGETPLLGVPGIDPGKGIAHFGKNADTYINVLMSYARNTKPLLDKIETVTDGALNDYAVVVHGIKGASYGIFAEEAGRLASALEKAAEAGDLAFIQANNGQFISVIRQLITDIEEAVQNGDGRGMRQTLGEPDRDVLRRFKEACASYDIDGMDAAMSEIEKYDYTNDNGLVPWLRASLDQGKYKAIKDRLGETV